MGPEQTSSMPAGAAGTYTLGDRQVRRLGFGAMRLTQRGAAFDPAATPTSHDEAVAVVRRAVELGVDHVDTAAFYFSSGLSANRALGDALAPFGDDVVVVTKVGPSRAPDGAWLPPASPEDLRAQVVENLEVLGRERLEVVNYRAQSGDSVASHLEALVALVDEGLVGHVGVSGVTLGQFEEACTVARIVCVQNALSPFRRDDALVAACERRGVAFVPFFSIAGSGRHRGPGDAPDELQGVATQASATPAQVHVAWALAQGPHVLVIPGTSSLAHLEENVEAASLRLAGAELAALDALAPPAG